MDMEMPTNNSQTIFWYLTSYNAGKWKTEGIYRSQHAEGKDTLKEQLVKMESELPLYAWRI